MKQYVCGICGYIHDEAVGGKWEDLPADWKCPVCKADKDAFKPKEEKTASQEVLEKPHVDNEKMEEKKMEKWKCTVCGYIHEGPEAPDQCPMCKVGKEKFVEVMEQEGNLEFVTEHVIGDGKGASKELWEGLQNHFMGECTEVGMYLAMSRQADREGYPEIAEAYKRYAWEEAEHASKFAELIGEVVWDTKTNLYKRMNAESGACEDKMRLARMAKEQNLDAVHDTVHEMAKDEARHGKGFEGLYKRYFGK